MLQPDLNSQYNTTQPLIVSGNKAIEEAMAMLLKSLVAVYPKTAPELISGGIIGIRTNSGMTMQFGFGAIEGRLG